MTDGLLQTFPGTFNTGKFLPPVSANPLALQPGAMMYVDPMDPADPWAAGAPVQGSTIKNLACWRFAEMVNNPGLARYTDYQLSFTDKHINSNELLIERTSKGGLHGLPSQVNNGVSDRGAYMNLAAALRQWVYDNPTHKYFFGVIGRKTRDRSVNTVYPRSGMLRLGTSNSKYRYVQDYASVKTSIAGNTNGGSAFYVGLDGMALDNTSLNVFVGAGESVAWPDSLPASAADMLAAPLIFGNSLDNNGAQNQVHGWIMYGLYMEDLTFSGRSYATVQAQLLAQAQADFKTGGRYANDTFTAPAAFP